MTLTETQRLALIACKDGKHRDRHQIRREAGLQNSVTRGTLPALIRLGLIEKHDALDPTTYTITETGLCLVQARNEKGT